MNPKLGQKVLYITPATCANVRLISKSRLKVEVGGVYLWETLLSFTVRYKLHLATISMTDKSDSFYITSVK